MLENKARQARANYMRAWRQRNKERIAEYNRRYWIKKANEYEETSQYEEGEVQPTMHKVFFSIKEACNETGLSQRFLRDGCKAGTVPHIKSGAKYLVNLPLLLERLNAESERGVTA